MIHPHLYVMRNPDQFYLQLMYCQERKWQKWQWHECVWIIYSYFNLLSDILEFYLSYQLSLWQRPGPVLCVVGKTKILQLLTVTAVQWSRGHMSWQKRLHIIIRFLVCIATAACTLQMPVALTSWLSIGWYWPLTIIFLTALPQQGKEFPERFLNTGLGGCLSQPVQSDRAVTSLWLIHSRKMLDVFYPCKASNWVSLSLIHISEPTRHA